VNAAAAHANDWPRLVGDVGATHARFALETEAGKLESILVLPCAAYPSLEAALERYLADEGSPPVRYAAIAIANPVDGDVVRMTNHPWRFSISAVQERFNLAALLVVNDFAALAMALPHLAENEIARIGEVGKLRSGVKGLIGPGTGLGVSYLVPTANGWQAQACEGGHVSLAADSRREADVLELVRAEYGHVSAERLVSGIGIPLLYRSLCRLDGKPDEKLEVAAPEVSRRALARESPEAEEAVQMFCGLLGSVAGNLALTLGSQGGIYIGGGVVPRLGPLFDRALFRRRFEAKGRFRDYLRAIPTYLITAPYPALAGSAALLAAHLVDNRNDG
jgi:glucokinase